MLLFIAKTAFHVRGSGFGECLSNGLFFFDRRIGFRFRPFGNEVRGDVMDGAISAIGIGGIDFIRADGFAIAKVLAMFFKG